VSVTAHAEALVAILSAVEFAARAHRDQRRKGASQAPYINHCLSVAARLARSGVTDAAVLQAAALHDVVEDTEITLAEIRVVFGAEVAGLVAEVTDDKTLVYAARKQAQIDHAPHKSPGAACIKIADKTSNLEDLVADPPDWPPTRLAAYVTWAEAVVAALPPVPAPLMAGFRDAVAMADARFRSTEPSPG
jgi:guanosine-3',5'-bis(diphosphate) 3'-pyrophosphohydrolase